ncbi:uncharacterized protein LOC119102255 isoform X2 [Pollicipes pollicipes]|nr:uncharacterized protein LOC119102255 isoform X2 [Pollicipes pollicipes]XP_037081517.1 uncharacterized protein LOC119102255 isoform X2 [Pollicipes pollicipes]XP_037081518.1 uncharacterized protein LOC119102255 isoform X2 [Pollicipes pollicipes]XP_037081519.1 uncharacterized protein LOC119102255 isoform X2 [Pollicipes pollicipes]XP_037081520.1 uncharacterized protein LOC119102255 isoform X2 [Pollicipes pollicipes]
MDAAVRAALEEGRAAGVAGLLAVDASGLCLAADGSLREPASGQLAALAAAARRVEPDAARPPLVAMETENDVCLVTCAGSVTTAVFKDK